MTFKIGAARERMTFKVQSTMIEYTPGSGARGLFELNKVGTANKFRLLTHQISLPNFYRFCRLSILSFATRLSVASEENKINKDKIARSS